jgi:hypothetical protein
MNQEQDRQLKLVLWSQQVLFGVLSFADFVKD